MQDHMCSIPVEMYWFYALRERQKGSVGSLSVSVSLEIEMRVYELVVNHRQDQGHWSINISSEKSQGSTTVPSFLLRRNLITDAHLEC